jgi:CheY-like chemotaxis protein
MRRMAAEMPLVLIAERDPNVRELQEHFLTRAGFTVEFASDGQSALVRAAEVCPAVIVTEILIPRLDGLALCRRLGEDPATRGIPVVVFSILAAAARAEEAGASAFLRKPLVETSFVGTIRDLIAPQSTGIKEQ